MNSIQLLFFASLGEQLGTTEEQLDIPSNIQDVNALKKLLSQRGETWDKHINNVTTKCAVNQNLATDKTTIKAGDEIAFFPPVTGG